MIKRIGHVTFGCLLRERRPIYCSYCQQRGFRQRECALISTNQQRLAREVPEQYMWQVITQRNPFKHFGVLPDILRMIHC